MKYDEEYFEGKTRSSGYPTRGGYGKLKNAVKSRYLTYLDSTSKYFNVNVYDSCGKKALDVGCAYGYVLELLKELGYEIYGIDISKYAVKKAKEALYGSPVLITHDAQTALPFKVKFDLISCFEVLEHVEKPELVIRNCYDTLTSKGVLIVSTPNNLSPLRYGFKHEPHINVKSGMEWKRIFNRFTWSNLKMFYFQWVPVIWRLTKKTTFFNLPLFGYSLLIVAQK